MASQSSEKQNLQYFQPHKLTGMFTIFTQGCVVQLAGEPRQCKCDSRFHRRWLCHDLGWLVSDHCQTNFIHFITCVLEHNYRIINSNTS